MYILLSFALKINSWLHLLYMIVRSDYGTIFLVEVATHLIISLWWSATSVDVPGIISMPVSSMLGAFLLEWMLKIPPAFSELVM